MNYFELFEMPVSFTPDCKQLKQKFYELSRKYHPDFFTHEGEAEQAQALEKSSQVNKAFRTFQDKDETIKYVLQLKGLLQEEEKYELPSIFLMEMMELNEAIMDAKIESDKDAMMRMIDSIGKTEKQIYEPVKTIIEGYTDDKTTTVELMKVKEYYYKKKYLKRILEATN